MLAASVLKTNKTELWHKRLGHMSLKGWELLHKIGVLKEKFDDMWCFRKQHRVHVPASPSPRPSSSSYILDYIHADVWGPANIPHTWWKQIFLFNYR